jgi:hypothetical protein
MNTPSEYIPGVCNIGREEIKRRKNSAIVSGLLSAALLVLLLTLHSSKLWRLTFFLPISYFGISVQQWYYHFCANFGLRGVFNFGDIGKTFTVDQQENFKKDRMKAQKMLVTSILFGLIITIAFYFLPF